MKKTLLIAGLALAASVITSQAQVYSQNIVGYVNTPVKPGYTALANPLDNATGNSLTNLIPGIVTGQYDASTIYVWNGTSYNGYFVDSGQGGLNDLGDNGNVPSPTINPGTCLFFNSAVASNTVTFVGTVHVDGTGVSTNVVGVTTNSLTGEKFVSSSLPVGGGIASVLELPTTGGSMDTDLLYVPNINGVGTLTGFTGYFIDWANYGGNGICDFGDNGLVPEPIIPVGSGLFIQVNSAVAWAQSY